MALGVRRFVAALDFNKAHERETSRVVETGLKKKARRGGHSKRYPFASPVESE
jgi:hypothetical protein